MKYTKDAHMFGVEKSDPFSSQAARKSWSFDGITSYVTLAPRDLHINKQGYRFARASMFKFLQGFSPGLKELIN